MGWFFYNRWTDANGTTKCQRISVKTTDSPLIKTELMPGKSRHLYRSQPASTLESQELVHSLSGAVDTQRAGYFLAGYPDVSKSDCLCVKLLQLRPTLWFYGLYVVRLLCPWDSPGKNTRVGTMPSSRGSSQPRDQTHISYVCCIGRQVTTSTWEAPCQRVPCILQDFFLYLYFYILSIFLM